MVELDSLSTLAVLLVQVLLSVSVLLGLTSAVVIGPTRLRTLWREKRSRLREALPYLALLVSVLVVNKFIRDVVPEVSWLIGLNVTSYIYSLEGATVADIQSVTMPGLTAYFSFVYVVGYVFLLIFPFLAYLALQDLRPLKRTALAYALNYSIGLLLYALFISYGPRNLIPDLVDPLLYSTYPQTQILTSKVNTNTNVFPSLHTSLSVTAAALAWQTREEYPIWLAVATLFAVSITLATMYLGIHWATDVVVGVALGLACVELATWYVDRE
ncbi:Membrane-associated phospholipid phosphatase [Halogranum amylolyticum]|uniref:Membrane-associated phospholipid phosphatase n=1 Tax=Halogranum amylolyticum TaxID=660520 RepID=A0A1H8WDT9_9EURY|nr:phosphatase PAP2 family protein [Halogranum amylolyticum]SEP25815.1 Membrane-associated phospholipid phosphatase [Halogranum amylolyticum]